MIEIVDISDQPVHVAVIGGFLALFLLLFLAYFFIPALIQSRKLGRLLVELVRNESRDLEALSALFGKDKLIGHLWSEFRHTLHEQKDIDASGNYVTTSIRQTVPAATYFSEEILVSSPLHAEFFKHVPGILTGLGIIGTFSGLILGLQAFQVSDNPQVVRSGLSALLGDVGHAFLVSALAIAAAMLVTLVEKSCIASLCRKVERLCLALDERFDAGAGEEYLARLVHSSESSAKEAKQLKQSLVNDLKHILEDLTERQIQSQNQATQSIAERIVNGIDEGLRRPLAEIGAAVQHVSGNQGEAVNKLLTDTMAAMTAQIRDLFAGQVDGIRGMQQQTIDNLSATVGRLEQLVSDIAAKGQQTTDAMSARLEATLASIVQSQQDSARTVQETIARMSTSVAEVAKALEGTIEAASSRDEHRTQQLTEQINSTTGQSAEVVQMMRQSVEVMRTVTGDIVDKMNVGAEKMMHAAAEMTNVGSSTSSALERAQSVSAQLAHASGALTSSTSLLKQAIEDYRTTRDTLAAMVDQLRATVDAARREASLTADILQRIERASESLKEAELQAENYLKGVSEVLQNAHQQFGTQIINTLDKVNGAFHQHMERSTKALAGTIDELDQVLDRVAAP